MPPILNPSPLPGIPLEGTYDLYWVLLSYLVAAGASFTALDLATRIRESSGKHWLLWTCASSLAMGGGIWSMHFIGMLALKLPVAVGYDLATTIFSFAVAAVSAGCAFAIQAGQRPLAMKTTLGALILGAGISAMHYSGMAAMRMDAQMHFHLPLFALSIGIAVGTSAVALWLTHVFGDPAHSEQTPLKTPIAGIMGLAVVGMHYTGMAAVDFFPTGEVLAAPVKTQYARELAIFVSIITSLVLGTSLYSSHLARRLSRHHRISEELALSAEDQEKRFRDAQELFKMGTLERRKIERSLQETQKRVQVIMNNVVDGIITIDEDSEIESFNPAAERIFGYSAVDMLGESVTQLMPEPYRQLHLEGIERYRKTRAAKNLGTTIEIEGLKKDGTVFPMELSVSEINLGDRHLFVGTFRDSSPAWTLSSPWTRATPSPTDSTWPTSATSASVPKFSIWLFRIAEISAARISIRRFPS